MSQIKNIIIVNDWAYINGGAGKVAISSALELAKMKYNVILFSAVGPESDQIKNSSIKVVITNQYDILTNPNRIKAAIQGIWNVKAMNKFKTLLTSLNPSDTVIHYHGWIKALSVSVLYAAKDFTCKKFITLHDFFLYCPNGGFYDYQKSCICTKKPLSLACISCNCDSRSFLQKQWRVLRQVVHNLAIKKILKDTTFVSISNLTEQIFKHEFGELYNIVRVDNPVEETNGIIPNYCNRNAYIFVARLSPEKGLDMFCEAITRLSYRGIVLGSGDLYEKYKSKYPNIEFAGWLNGIQKVEYINQTKCLVFPSRWYECAPLTPKEFLSYGIPCIVPDKCAASEVIQDGINGYIFKSGCIESLINKLEKMENSIFNPFIVKSSFINMTINDHINQLITLYNN